MATKEDITDDLFKAIETFQSLKCELNDKHVEYYDSIKKIFEKTMDDLAVRTGKFLHEIHVAQPSEEMLENIIGAVPSSLNILNVPVPSSLSSLNNKGQLHIESAVRIMESLKYVPYLAKEGIKHNVGGVGKRGGLLVRSACNLRNTLHFLLNAGDDNNPVPHDTACVSVIKKLQDFNLFQKKDIKDYNLFYWSCGPRAQLRFAYIADCDPAGLKTHYIKGFPLIHVIIKLEKIECFSVFLREAMKHHPEEIGLLFQKDADGQTACERAIKKYGIQETMKAIKERIPCDVDTEPQLPILHFVAREIPQYMNRFAARYPSAVFLRDARRRTMNQAKLMEGSTTTFEKETMFFLKMSDDELREFDYETDLCPFILAASGETSDLSAVYYLLSRNPSMIAENAAHLSTGRRKL